MFIRITQVLENFYVEKFDSVSMKIDVWRVHLESKYFRVGTII